MQNSARRRLGAWYIGGACGSMRAILSLYSILSPKKLVCGFLSCSFAFRESQVSVPRAYQKITVLYVYTIYGFCERSSERKVPELRRPYFTLYYGFTCCTTYFKLFMIIHDVKVMSWLTSNPLSPSELSFAQTYTSTLHNVSQPSAHRHSLRA